MQIEPLNIIVSGPTASGKTALAVGLALQHDAIVVNADSMQVYADLHCLSARPTLDEMQDVPHMLFGHVDGAEYYSVGRWLQDVMTMQKQYPDRAMIFCGGTGMYLKALLEGFTDTPAIPAEIRADLRQDYTVIGHDAFLARLLNDAPDALAHLAQAPDQQRTLRAAEVVYATKQPLTYWHKHAHTAPLLTGVTHLAIMPDRAALYGRINQRCQLMFDDALSEVSKLILKKIPENQPIMRCIGVSILADYLAGNCTEETAMTQFSKDTRHYAKRQLTWLRHQMQPDHILTDFGSQLVGLGFKL